MKQDTYDTKWYETYKSKCRLDTSLLTTNKDGMKINADVNGKNWLRKEYVIKYLIGILAIVNVHVINHVMLNNI